MRRLITPLVVALAVASLAPPEAPAAPPERALYRVAPARGADLRGLLTLGLDRAGYGPGSAIDFILSPDEVDRVRSLGFDPVPLRDRSGPLGAPQTPLAQPDLGAYHTYSEAVAEMAAYAAAHPTISRLDTLGTSLQGRPIIAIEISDQPGVDEEEPEAFVNGCHHARELMSVELPLFAMRRLLDGYGVDPALTSLVDSRRIWIAPVVNPDGYVYVEQNANGQSSGWWRKNRRPNGDGTIGVDLNRNYDWEWGRDDIGSSPVPSSETYRGTGPFSEPETAALRDFVDARRFAVAVSFHSYGELVLYPWGYDRLDTPEADVFAALAESVTVWNGYRAGNPKSNTIYLTNGSSDDWLYGASALRPAVYGFTIELNTAEEGGFDPPESRIAPTCQENWSGLLALLRFADQPRRALGPRRPQTPRVVVGTGGQISLRWSYPAPDPANEAARHDVRRIAEVQRATDDAESGIGEWEAKDFEWSDARSAGGTRSFWSGSADNRVSLLASRASLDVAPGESLVTWAWWSLEDGFDYWYAQVSIDGGATWSSLVGPYTTNLNPNGNNEGFGITGSSGGGFVRATFSLLPFVGKQALVRLRCTTDAVGHLEGLYLDDIAPTPRYSGVEEVDTGSPDSVWAVVPLPTAPAWFQVRGRDAEAQTSFWSDRVLFSPSVASVAESASHPAWDRLAGIAPNPANPQADVRFTLAAGAPGRWRIDCFDASGRWIGRVAEGVDNGAGGPRRAAWSGRDREGRELPSGIYFLRLTHGAARSTVKAALVR